MKIVFGLVLCWIVSGCWGAEPASDESGAGPSLGQPASLQPSDGAEAASQLEARPVAARVLDKHEGGTAATCRALMVRQRECSAVFIPALVAARVERDDPPGTAAHSRDVGREALVTEALDEWASDSRDEAIDVVCSEIARVVAPGRVQELESSVSGCLQQLGCDAFVACAVPVNLGHWKG